MVTKGAWRNLSKSWMRVGMLAMALSGASLAGDPSGFAGTWIRDRANGESIGKAIESYVADFDSVMKIQIGERLGEVSRSADQLVIAVVDSGRKIGIGENGRVGTAVSLDGKAVSIQGESGETFVLSRTMAADKLSESYQADDGSRTNVYSVADKGRSLLVDVKIESPYMPKPLFYKLVYTRK
jgi:hypothetical protein